ncbi:MAG: 16S rRNA (guanine(966)-N(2))-methyltransferase RsmD [Gammaproteobacteria bacterium]|nr:16S rRNA (guanine(966)-N(2))-methyltransferase RsmD [Gammaproteobacteria bacterium]
MATNRRQIRELRIIAGTWRARRLRFPAGPDIRPTPDRVRETLFNWLAPVIRGARVLDLFAGSGALGLEALSRGAAQVHFIDTDARATAALRELLVEWRAEPDRVETSRADALSVLQLAPAAMFAIVFIDPPFAAGLWTEVASRLERNGWLTPEAFVYVEAPVGTALDALPANWQPWREGTAGEVGYHLFRRVEPTTRGTHGA